MCFRVAVLLGCRCFAVALQSMLHHNAPVVSRSNMSRWYNEAQGMILLCKEGCTAVRCGARKPADWQHAACSSPNRCSR